MPPSRLAEVTALNEVLAAADGGVPAAYEVVLTRDEADVAAVVVMIAQDQIMASSASVAIIVADGVVADNQIAKAG